MPAKPTLQTEVLEALSRDYRQQHRDSLLCRYLFERYTKRFCIAAKLALATEGIPALIDCMVSALLEDPAFRRLNTIEGLGAFLALCDRAGTTIPARGSSGAQDSRAYGEASYRGASPLALRKRIKELESDPAYFRIRAALARDEQTVRALAATMLAVQSEKRPNLCIKTMEFFLDEVLAARGIESAAAREQTKACAHEALSQLAEGAFDELRRAACEQGAALRAERETGATAPSAPYSPFDHAVFKAHIGALLDKKGYEWLSNAGALGDRSTVANVKNLDIALVELCLNEPGFLPRRFNQDAGNQDATPEEMCQLLRSVGKSSIAERLRSKRPEVGFGRETIVPVTADSTFSAGLFVIAEGWFENVLGSLDVRDREFLERHGAVFAAIFLSNIDTAQEGYLEAVAGGASHAQSILLGNGYTCITFTNRLAATVEGARGVLTGYRRMRAENHDNEFEYASWNIDMPPGVPPAYERYFRADEERNAAPPA